MTKAEMIDAIPATPAGCDHGVVLSIFEGTPHERPATFFYRPYTTDEELCFDELTCVAERDADTDAEQPALDRVITLALVQWSGVADGTHDAAAVPGFLSLADKRRLVESLIDRERGI